MQSGTLRADCDCLHGEKRLIQFLISREIDRGVTAGGRTAVGSQATKVVRERGLEILCSCAVASLLVSSDSAVGNSQDAPLALFSSISSSPSVNRLEAEVRSILPDVLWLCWRPTGWLAGLQTICNAG